MAGMRLAQDLSDQVEQEMDEQMAQMALNELPQDDFYGDQNNNDDDDDDDDAAQVKGGKKKRGWLGKMGKGLYKRTMNVMKSGGPSTEDEDIKARVLACRSPYAVKDGGIGVQDPEHQKICRSVLSLMIKQMGRNLLTGGNVMNVSFPIQCCQPRTVLEIGACIAGFTHMYLPRAAATPDPVERLKNVVACFVAATTLTSGNFLKPLNPILGETLQMDYADGAKLYMEQTCHHPPVSAFCLYAPDNEYTVSGHQTFDVGFGYNKMYVTNKGVRIVTFKDGGQIKLDFPPDRFGNVFWGDMVHETLGSQTYTDEKNKIRCRLSFGERKNVPSDWFEGVIEQYNPSNPEEEGQMLSHVEGSWVGFVDFDSVRYWDIRTTEKMGMWAPARTLPSDSRNRSDRNFLAAKDFKKAQSEKIRLEEVQRSERKLREAVHGKH